jgi:hypothetical protein
MNEVAENVGYFCNFHVPNSPKLQITHWGEPLWLSSKVVKNEKINDIERTWVRSPPRATSLEN